jgi:drug/metabolite transporter (DMT)-like permease
MENLGVGLGVVVALLWGSADILATLAAHRLNTFKTTFVSQSVGLLALLAFGTVSYCCWHLRFTGSAFAFSALIGMFTGLCAALGYFAFYRALEIGPVALVSPLTATSSMFTIMLSMLILNEQLTIGHMVPVLIVILGILLASTSLTDLRAHLRKPGNVLWSQGVRLAVVATLAFGAMDFGIGASASIAGWFLPVFWTRFFSLIFLLMLSLWKRHQRLMRTYAVDMDGLQGKRLSLSLPNLDDFTHMRNPFSTIGLGFLLAVTAGIVENAAVLIFSLDTRIATTGITSAITSSYSLVVVAFGILAYGERLTKSQFFGIIMFMGGLVLLAV